MPDPIGTIQPPTQAFPPAAAPAPAPAPAQAPALDPDIINLAKAIRNTETQGQTDPYTAKGASGEFGAYQFTNDTWAKNAAKYGVTSKLSEANRADQNKVAYNMILDLKKAGNNPGQIASIWNSGKPNWQGNVGVNKFGVKYDTPQYVKSVYNTYQSYKSGQDATIEPTSSTVGNEQYGTPPTIPTEQQNADQQNAQDTGATFAADTSKDGVLSTIGKTLGNMPSSIFGFAKGALSTLNPINIVKNIGGIASGLGEISKTPGGLMGYAKQLPIGLPEAAYQSLVPEAGKNLVNAGLNATGASKLLTPNAKNVFAPQNDTGAALESAQRNVVNNPFGSVAPFVLAGEGGLKVIDKVAGTDMAGAVNNTISKTGEMVTKPVTSMFGKASEALTKNLATKFSEAAGEVFQPKTPYETQVAQKVAANVDWSGLPKNATYSQLSDFLQKNIDEKLGKTDQILSQYQETFKPDDLQKTVTGEGGSTATINYTKEAINGLKDLYESTKDPESLVKIKDLESKFNKEGLTSKELNDLAKKYGTEFGKKAFGKMGEPMTGTNAQAYETIRKGVKENARGTLPNDEAKALDKNSSSLIRAKAMSDRMSQAVEKLSNKVKDRNLGQKIGRALGTAADLSSGGVLRGFIARLFPSNIGLKTMNSLDLEAGLSKNLNVIQSLSNAPDNIIINTLKRLAKKANNVPASFGATGSSNQRITSNFGK